MKKLPIGRSIAYVLAGVLIVAGVFSLTEAYRFRRELHQKINTRPLDLVVDLSQPGESIGEIHQTWRDSHGQTINLHIPMTLVTGASPSNLLEILEPLDFKWQIADADGQVVVDYESSGPKNWQISSDGDEILLAYFHPFDLGTYTFKLTVVTGAPRLAGVQQRIVCQYQPCGLEMLPAIFGTIQGIAALVIAGIILLVVMAITRRKQRETRHQQRGQVSSDGAPSDEPST